MKLILPFVDDASNWYVRRSRRRFWKSDEVEDKNNAYKTLHYVLTQLSMVIAPFVPFLAEELYTLLTGEESVHLLDWPKVGHINELVLHDMHQVRELINQGLSQRAASGIKVRQPLKCVTVQGTKDLAPELVEIIAEELNVKEVKVSKVPHENDLRAEIDTTLNPKLREEGVIREVIRQVQNARKAADLQVDDRIKLSLFSSEESLKKAILNFSDIVSEETLATELDVKHMDYKHSSEVMVEGMKLSISLER
jgi:isoleucyl-tRNA synthetase